MSYSESRNHFEKARLNTADAVTIEMLDGLKHLSHAIEEDLRRLEQHIRNIQESAASRKVCS
jgi:predicted GTPase